MGQTRILESKSLLLSEAKDDLPNLVGVLPGRVEALVVDPSPTSYRYPSASTPRMARDCLEHVKHR